MIAGMADAGLHPSDPARWWLALAVEREREREQERQEHGGPTVETVSGEQPTLDP